jgi:hypothetical protein
VRRPYQGCAVLVRHGFAQLHKTLWTIDQKELNDLA